MSTSRIRRPVLAAVALTVLVALGGCGRRGPLELPPGAPQQPAGPNSGAAQARALDDKDQPGLIQSPDQVYEKSAADQQQVFKAAPAPRAINAAPADRPTRFLLDPLL